jgi:hypothetical protein
VNGSTAAGTVERKLEGSETFGSLFLHPFVVAAVTPWFAAWGAVLTHDGPSPEGSKDIGRPCGEAYRKKWDQDEKH